MSQHAPRVDPGSFRDPGGRVYHFQGRIFRALREPSVADFEFVRATGLLDTLAADELLLPVEMAGADVHGVLAAGEKYVLEQPKLPFISYPYEWTFPMLKAAALTHLEIHLRALEHSVTLSDASAYNIQFDGPRPIFIDTLSFRRYREGEFWTGHRQFCEQFLNPLLMRALCGLPHNAWYRGTQEGIAAEDLNRLLSIRRKLSWNVLSEVTLQAIFQRAGWKDGGSTATEIMRTQELPLPAYRRSLERLQAWIEDLLPAGTGKTGWADYSRNNSYGSEASERKRAFVAAFVDATRPRMLWDLGCNSGDFATLALASGAARVVGFDVDQSALEFAFGRARAEGLALLPLCVDLANPSPSQGWAERERRGIRQRASADAVIALALVHHLAIGRNIPLEQIAEWLTALAPAGVVEFVPKADPMVQRLLAMRDDIFEDYTEQHFIESLQARARIVKTEAISAEGRALIWFERARSAGKSAATDEER